jgi:hypothetical protein
MMLFPPNSAEVTKRRPQNGIRVAGTLSDSQQKAAPPQPITVKCLEDSCSNMVNVVHHGHHENEEIAIKIRCKECYRAPYSNEWMERTLDEGDFGQLAHSGGVDELGGPGGRRDSVMDAGRFGDSKVDAGGEEDMQW